MQDQPLAVDAEGLCRRYGRRWALANVSLTVRRGTVQLIAGRNGSGKSTLLRILSTAIRADRGWARIEGFDLRTQAEAVRQRSALLTHHLYLYDSLTALENLQITARFLGCDASREALSPLLAEVGLEDRAEDTPATFSAGMRKRLALARVLAQSATVVFLDEPYGQLDPPGFRLVDRFLATLRERGATVVLATHLLERTSPLCDNALVLEAGRAVWRGPAGELADAGVLDVAGLPEGAQ